MEDRKGMKSEETGKLIAINISEKKGVEKKEIRQGICIENWGLEGDAHGGRWHRQVSLLSLEKISEFQKKGGDVSFGSFGENLIIEGLDLKHYSIGTRFQIGEVELELTQVGKKCHNHCQIYKKMGDCIMPREGVFAVVRKGGMLHKGDSVLVKESNLYNTVLHRPKEAEGILATVVEGKHQGEQLLFLQGILRSDGEKAPFLKKYQKELGKVNVTSCFTLEGETVFCGRLEEKPRVILCGGGHVSLQVIPLAKRVGFEVWVLEDRPSFANQCREVGADRVICNAFQRGLKELPQNENHYFVCVTRGHRHDMVCLQEILPLPKSYLGVMGSRRRSGLVRASLRQMGFEQEKVDQIQSPIGLDIQAETPEEIAVSIVGELILWKNKKTKGSYLNGEILAAWMEEESKLPKVLCTIIEKKGSTPRALGTQMVVRKDGRVFGTIGGGCGEARVIEAARNLMTKEERYSTVEIRMTEEEAEEEGMVCGGIIRLFLETKEE